MHLSVHMKCPDSVWLIAVVLLFCQACWSAEGRVALRCTVSIRAFWKGCSSRRTRGWSVSWSRVTCERSVWSPECSPNTPDPWRPWSTSSSQAWEASCPRPIPVPIPRPRIRPWTSSAHGLASALRSSSRHRAGLNPESHTLRLSAALTDTQSLQHPTYTSWPAALDWFVKTSDSISPAPV